MTAGPVHVDLMTHDIEAARAFYGAVLGWAFEEWGPASLALADGRQAAAIGPSFDGTTTGWTLYFGSTDIAATEASIVAAGGSLVLPHGDVAELGKLLLAADPSGARFGIWQAGTKKGVDVWGAVGSPCWTDLRSSDPAAAQAFYAASLGFEMTPFDMAGPDYATYSTDGDPLGGVGGMMGAPDGTRSHWLIYFAVPSADDAAAAVAPAGGTLLSDPFDTPFGRMAPAQDPAGHPFWITQLPS
ncbi:MAG: Glyoxalase/bleomycin resistance protein/dioxygenase [Frankiales bacterium]|nr:Glyoxalase/bleomycin resistance protein/dioxygenase [Frankiales bacterium]